MPGAAAAAPDGAVTADTLRQGWSGVLETLKSRPKGRVAWMVLSNASVVSLDEGVLILRFPRQGDVKGFQAGKYEDTLKEVLHARFGVNVVVRAISGGDPPPAGRRPEPPAPSPAPPGQAPGDAASRLQAAGSGVAGQPPVPPAPPAGDGQAATPASAGQPPAAPPAPSAGRTAGTAGTTPAFGIDDLPPLPSSPPDDDEFDPDDEDMSVSVASELTGMALVQRELGAEIIAEYDD